MPAGTTDKLLDVGSRGTLTNLVAPGKAVGATSLTLVSASNWPTASLIVFSLRKVYIGGVNDGKEVPGTYTQWSGILSGTTISSLTLLEGTDQNYSGGTETQAFIHVSTGLWSKLITGLKQTLNIDGTIKTGLTIPSPILVTPTVTTPPANIGRFTGEIATCALRTPPSGWLLCDGAAVARSTYSDLFTALNPSMGTFTITIASPAVVTLTAHGLKTGAGIYMTTTGALPTGVSVNTQYFAIVVDANTFRLATSQANAMAGTAINTSGSQSGTHTAVFCPNGVGDGSTTFNVPNLKGRVLVGLDPSDTDFDTLGKNVGAKTHTLTTNEMPSHTHGTHRFLSPDFNSSTAAASGGATWGAEIPASSGGGAAHNNMQPSAAWSFIVKT